MKKNILMVTPFFYPEGGGLGNYTFQIAKKLIKKGYNITVISLSREKDISETIEGIKIFRKKYSFCISNTPINLFFLFDILKLLKKEKFDLIHGHTPVPFAVDMAALASFFKKIPFVVSYHSGSLYKGNLLLDFLAGLYKIFEYFTLRRAKKIVIVSEHIRESLKRWKQKMVTITPGVNLKMFNLEQNYPQNKNILLFIGPLKKSYLLKGLAILLEALAKVKKEIPDIELRVVGGGELVNHYRSLSKKLDIEKNVEFLGEVPYQKIPAFFQESSILIVPSIMKTEGCPTVIFEAMAASRPVIGSRIAGIPYIIKEGYSGLLFEPFNVKELAQKIIWLLEHKDKAKEMGENGRKLVEKYYTWNHIAEKYTILYENIQNKTK